MDSRGSVGANELSHRLEYAGLAVGPEQRRVRVVESERQIIYTRSLFHEIEVEDSGHVIAAELDVVVPEVAMHELAANAIHKRSFCSPEFFGEEFG